MRVSLFMIVKDEISGGIKNTPFGFDTAYVKDWSVSTEFKNATYVTFSDDFGAHLAIPFSDFDNMIMGPQFKYFKKASINEALN